MKTGLAMPPPESKIRITTPNLYQGEALSIVNRLLGVITWIGSEGETRTIFHATLPGENVEELKKWLHASTNGQATVIEEKS